ncbi:MAG: 50S ribosomal protein L35 [Verrucomicrobia bacterium]|nr:50S ribosomal protein L35 [Verrucomicrobiota bacterium]MCG2681706.1 50S ribosomal protein L35 [Kiritimatiellia bacterium]MBU4248521.1 50S ribosomal protein L35 [Verrucomicrobiota bacterium]MBU4290194.1 50S ribosomal protein L35 [Verrucomicrobiota bacterium]MBU4428228.1 50S ribosomal protein L35 [Verrucomicrobiota bacterium]
MPKMKTKKAIAKRFRKTASGKIRHLGAGRGHILTSKSSKRKRQARRGSLLAKSEEKRLIHLF